MEITKKWTIAVAALVMIAFLSSCQTKEIYEEYYYVESFTKDYTVKQGSWIVKDDDDSGIYYYCGFEEPELTEYIYENGIMQAFLLMNGGNLSPLPFDDFWMDGNYHWTEQVTCEFRPGYIRFILKYSDHATAAPYYEYTFRVRFLW